MCFHGFSGLYGHYLSFLVCVLQVGENIPIYGVHLFAGDCHEVEDVRCAGHVRPGRL